MNIRPATPYDLTGMQNANLMNLVESSDTPSLIIAYDYSLKTIR